MSAEPLTAEEIGGLAVLLTNLHGLCSCSSDPLSDPCPRCEAEGLLPGWASRMLATIAAREAEVRRLSESLERCVLDLDSIRSDCIRLSEEGREIVGAVIIRGRERDRAREEAAAWRGRAAALYQLASSAWMSTTILSDPRVERADAKFHALGIDPDAPEST